jgi:hypothetical protein
VKHIITDETPNYPIQPKDINTNEHFWDAFGNAETEVSANWLVRFAKAGLVGWRPFTAYELEKFYLGEEPEPGRMSFRFNRLYRAYNDTDPSYDLIQFKGDKFYFTHEFISACFRSSPELDPSTEVVEYGKQSD